MEESQLYANCIALALDVVRLYTMITQGEELELQFEAVDMTQNIQSQKLIFNVLCEQIVTLHSHMLLQSDVNELINRLLFSAMDLPLHKLHQINNAMKTHLMIKVALKNFLIEEDLDLELFSLINIDEKYKVSLNPVAVQDLAPIKLRSTVSSTLNLSVLSEPEMSNVVPTTENVTVFNEEKQTFTSVFVLPIEQLWNKLIANIPLTNKEKAFLFLTLDKLNHMYYWSEQL